MSHRDHPGQGDVRTEADRVSAQLLHLCSAWEDGTPPGTDDIQAIIEDLGRLRTLVERSVLDVRVGGS